MLNKARPAWCAAMKLVPSRFRADFCRFIEEGEANDEFLKALERDPRCRQACEIMFRSDALFSQALAATDGATPFVDRR